MATEASLSITGGNADGTGSFTATCAGAADQAFFNAKGGKIGIWTAAAPNALLDDFGGGTLP